MRECGIEMELRKMGRGERMSRVVELRYINAGTEIKEFIIITTREAMSHSDMPEEQAHSQIYENNPSEHSSCTNRLILTPQQAAYLTKLLPASFSLQTEVKALKRGASVSKSIKEKAPSQLRKKSTKEEPKSLTSKNSSGRPQKGGNPRYTQEVENAVYQKYNAQKDYRRNSFQNVSEAVKPCVRILNLLKNNRTSWPFREPVDPIALGIPHYCDIIKQPMDLSTIENNLRTNQYITPTQFHADVAKIITNSYTFNSANTEFTRITAEFENYYRKITAEPGSQLARGYSQSQMADAYPSKLASLESKKSKKQTKQMDYSQSSGPSISMAEKKELGLNIKKLPKEDMKGILDIVKDGTGRIIGEFDLKELDPAIIRKLQVYVKERLSGQNKPKGMNGDNANNENEQESSFEVSQGDESE